MCNGGVTSRPREFLRKGSGYPCDSHLTIRRGAPISFHAWLNAARRPPTGRSARGAVENAVSVFSGGGVRSTGPSREYRGSLLPALLLRLGLRLLGRRVREGRCRLARLALETLGFLLLLLLLSGLARLSARR